MTSKEAIHELKNLKDYGQIFFIERDMPNNLAYMSQALDTAIEALENQKTGRWIKYGSPRCGEQHYKCTSCGYYINFGQWGELYTKEFKYCPNCGVNMRGE